MDHAVRPKINCDWISGNRGMCLELSASLVDLVVPFFTVIADEDDDALWAEFALDARRVQVPHDALRALAQGVRGVPVSFAGRYSPPTITNDEARRPVGVPVAHRPVAIDIAAAHDAVGLSSLDAVTPHGRFRLLTIAFDSAAGTTWVTFTADGYRIEVPHGLWVDALDIAPTRVKSETWFERNVFGNDDANDDAS